MDASFSPDGRRVVSNSSHSALKLWDTKTGLEVGTLYSPGGGFIGFAFSRDGNTIFSGSYGDVRIWPAPSFDQLDARGSGKASATDQLHSSSVKIDSH